MNSIKKIVSDLIRKQLLREVKKSEFDEISRFSVEILDYMSAYGEDRIADSIGSTELKMPSTTLKGMQVDIDSYDSIKGFVEDVRSGQFLLPLYFKFFDSTTKGEYVRKNKSIFLYYGKDFENDFYNYVLKNGKRATLPLIQTFIEYWFKDAFVHELWHAYDDWRTSGWAYINKRNYKHAKQFPGGKIAVDHGEAEESINNKFKNMYHSYLKLPVEIWARMASAIDRTDFDSYFEKDGLKLKKIIEFNTVFQEFKDHMIEWDVLSGNQQKRISNAFYKLYDEHKDHVEEYNQDQYLMAGQQVVREALVHKLNESSKKEIEEMSILARDLLYSISTIHYKKIAEYMRLGDRERMPILMKIKRLDPLQYGSNYEVLMPFIKGVMDSSDFLNSQITFEVDPTKDNGGGYNSRLKLIKLYYPVDFYKSLLKTSGPDILRPDPDEIQKCIFKKFHNVLVHELWHMYDDWRTQGRVFTKGKKWKGFKKKFGHSLNNSKLDSHREAVTNYYNLPHEMWARVAQSIALIDFSVMTSFDEVYKKFKKNFDGWNSLDEQNRRKMIKSIYKIWKNSKEEL